MTPKSNPTTAESSSRCVVELISNQVRRNPNAVAVSCGTRALTYERLDTLSSLGAFYLRGLGIEKQVPVAVCMSRGVNAIVALLAVLKAGAVFVPLDPGHPLQRLAFTVTHAQVRALLTDRPDMWSGQAIDAEVVDVSQLPMDDLPGRSSLPVIDNIDLAYIIYTSGSTGQPKGVMVEHGAFAYHIGAMRRLYGLHTGDRVLQLSSLAFDASLESIFSTLSAGAELVISRDLLGPPELIDIVRSRDITVMELTPAHWAQVVDVLPSRDATALGSLRLLILGGDVVPAGTLEKFIAICPDIKLLNTYGPTEATIACTAFEVPPDWRGSVVPIGRPSVPEKQVYVLDAQLNLVPDGDIGEICVAGPGLARGYLHDPVSTAERFVTRYSSEGEPPERIYRTGDRGVKRADGAIEFVGRMDRQVKVRGMRVEPVEIESLLSGHPAVLGAIVVPVGDLNSRRLVAYVQWARGARESLDDLRSFARERLPGYMLPASWITVDSIPTTVAGKVDISALVQSDSAESTVSLPAHGVISVEPEEVIADIWRDVLNVSMVAMNDNFFYLGGHSLSAMQATFRLGNRFSVEIPLTAIFSHPTPHDMAEFVRSCLQEAIEEIPSEGVPAPPEGTDRSSGS